MNTLAVSQRKMRSNGPCVPSHRPADAARYATAMFTSVPEQLNRQPSTTICSATEPRSGSTNCGRNARKNSATFGFRMFVTAPWRKIAHSLVRSSGLPDTGPALPRNACTPSQIRYAAPANRTISYASGTACNNAASPDAIATVCTTEPAAMPSADITPARRPCVRLRVET